MRIRMTIHIWALAALATSFSLLFADEEPWGRIAVMRGGRNEPVLSRHIEREETVNADGGRTVLFTIGDPDDRQDEGWGVTFFIQPRHLRLTYSQDATLTRVEAGWPWLMDPVRSEYSVFSMLLAFGALDLDPTPLARAERDDVLTVPLDLFDKIEVVDVDLKGETQKRTGFRQMRHSDEAEMLSKRKGRRQPYNVDFWRWAETPQPVWILQLESMPSVNQSLRLWLEGEINAPKTSLITEWGGVQRFGFDVNPSSMHYWVIRIGDGKESSDLARAISRYTARYGGDRRERLRPDESPDAVRGEWRWRIRWRIDEGQYIEGQARDRRHTRNKAGRWLRRTLDMDWQANEEKNKFSTGVLPLSIDLALEEVTGRFRVHSISVRVQPDTLTGSREKFAELMRRCVGILTGVGGLRVVGKSFEEEGLAPVSWWILDFSASLFVVTDGKSNVELAFDDLFPSMKEKDVAVWRWTRNPIPLSEKWPDEKRCEIVAADAPSGIPMALIVQRGDFWGGSVPLWFPPGDASVYVGNMPDWRNKASEAEVKKDVFLEREYPSIEYLRRARNTRIYSPTSARPTAEYSERILKDDTPEAELRRRVDFEVTVAGPGAKNLGGWVALITQEARREWVAELPKGRDRVTVQGVPEGAAFVVVLDETKNIVAVDSVDVKVGGVARLDVRLPVMLKVALKTDVRPKERFILALVDRETRFPVYQSGILKARHELIAPRRLYDSYAVYPYKFLPSGADAESKEMFQSSEWVLPPDVWIHLGDLDLSGAEGPDKREIVLGFPKQFKLLLESDVLPSKP